MSLRRAILSSVAVLAGGVGFTLACSQPAGQAPPDDEEGSGGDIGTSTGGAPAGGGSTSSGGTGNTSDGGTMGEAGGSNECSGFAKTEPGPADFSPCGGEPFGTWRSTSVGWRSWEVGLGTRIEEAGGYRVRFEDGGTLTWARDQALVDASYGATCPGDGGPIIDFDPKTPEFEQTCDALACGICVCEFAFEQILVDGDWTRTDTTLTVTLHDYDPMSFEYCVAGDEMTLVGVDGRSMVLERVEGVLTRLPCAGRAVEECVGDCSPGRCVGEADCDLESTETECLTRQGCEWQADYCAGDVQSSCSLAEFDRVPGCEFVDSAHCEGVPDACWTIAEETCEEQLGCEAELSCGGEPIPCSYGNYDSGVCAELSSCSFDDELSTCEGTAVRCEDFGITCYPFDSDSGCEPYPCSGTPTPCEELDTVTCGQVQGCSVVVD